MKAPTMRRQKTIQVDGDAIKMVARRRTKQANFMGWRMNVNGCEYWVSTLTVEEAFELAYVWYVKNFR